jgi:hypothetical protein
MSQSLFCLLLTPIVSIVSLIHALVLLVQLKINKIKHIKMTSCVFLGVHYVFGIKC